jgi:hypothetical protein
MRMHRGAPRSPTRRGLTLFAGLLALAGRSVGAQGQPAAQAGDSVPMELVFVVFPDTTAADKAMSKLTPAQQGYIESSQVVSKGKSGQMTGQQRHDKAGNSAQTQQAGQMIDGVYALLNQRPTPNTAGAARDSSSHDSTAQGYAPGGAGRNRRGVSSADMTKMQDMLQPGQAAVILVVDNPHANDIEQALSPGPGPDGVVIQLVPVPE